MLERLKRTIGKIGDFREDNEDDVKNLITGCIFGVGITSMLMYLVNTKDEKISHLSGGLWILGVLFAYAPTSESLDLIDENEE